MENVVQKTLYIILDKTGGLYCRQEKVTLVSQVHAPDILMHGLLTR